MSIDRVKAIVFDVFGTVVDWRSSVAEEGRRAAAGIGVADFDGEAFADAWRAGYEPKMKTIRDGERDWTTNDVLHRERLEEIIPEFGLDALPEPARAALNKSWHRLNPWPDSIAGLHRLKSRYAIGTLSNGSFDLLLAMARNAGLPWDFILNSDVFGAFKPDPRMYLGAVDFLGGDPEEVMMLAAHNRDLKHARKHGLGTAFVCRPTEYGANTFDTEARHDWDIVADSIEEVADRMGV